METLLTNVFDVQAEKSALVRLSPHPDDWEPQIVEHLQQTVPELASHSISVRFPHVDDRTGTAVGAARVDEKVAIPLIVDRQRLSSLDVFYADDDAKRLQPLTSRNIMGVLASTGPGRSVTPGLGEMTDQPLLGQVTPPFTGRYAFAENLSVPETQLVGMVDDAFPNQNVLNRVLEANSSFADVLTAYHDKTAEYKPQTESRAGVTFVDDRPFRPAKTAGIYEVKVGADSVTGLVFDIVTDLAGKVVDDVRITHTKAATMVGNGVPGGRSVSSLPETIEGPEPSGYGFFGQKVAAHAVATLPIRIHSTSVKNGMTVYNVTDWEGKRVKVARVDTESPVTQASQYAVVPSSWTWFPITTIGGVRSAKEANQAVFGPDVIALRSEDGKITSRGLHGVRQEGESWSKIAAALRPTLSSRAIGEIHTRIKSEKVARFIPTPPRAPVTSWTDIRPQNLLKTAAMIRELPESIEDPIRGVEIKLSAEEAGQTIDSMLSLGFLDDSTVSRFIEFLTPLTDARDKLAELLLASHLGLDLDPTPVRTAMFALNGVVDDLTELRNSTAPSGTAM